MSTNRIRLLATAVALAAGLLSPAAAWAFRCGNRLVVEGDMAAEVRARCGAPADVSRGRILRPPVVWLHGRPVPVGHDAIELPMETWTYNLGPRRLMRRLRFEDGVLVRIDTLGYGYP
jgi:hypothetical protein